jgi:deoxyadenosine/deoxycytidine kinase
MYARTENMWTPKGYVYLRSDPLKCIQRIAMRARNAEDAIPADYMMHLHTLHEEAYANAVAQGKSIICIDVEGKTVPEIGEEVWSAFTQLYINA